MYISPLNILVAVARLVWFLIRAVWGVQDMRKLRGWRFIMFATIVGFLIAETVIVHSHRVAPVAPTGPAITSSR